MFRTASNRPIKATHLNNDKVMSVSDQPPALESRGACQRLLTALDHIARLTGALCAALIPLMVLVTVVVVVMRRGFSLGSIALQESIIYMHGFVFLMAMAYTLKSDAHVRVDIFYRRFSPRNQAWVNALGGLVLLLPLCVVLLVTSGQYAARSWYISETSAEAGGLPFLYLLKSLMPLAAGLLLLQCGAEVLANTLRLIGRSPSRPDA